ncbi:glycosyltransferase family 2 protein [Labrenzia sp. ac12]
MKISDKSGSNTHNGKDQMKTMFSIIICTYNRSDILSICINSIAKLNKNKNFDYEILIVDNNSKDATQKAVQDFFLTLPSIQRNKWSYHLERLQGLSNARNRGVSESRGNWLVFLDDECDVDADWLDRLYCVIGHKSPVMVGGPYRGKYLPEIDKRHYAKGFLEKYGDSYHIRDDWQERWLSKPGLSGGNMAIRRDLLEKVGTFDPNFGMSGSETRYGEETELQLRILALCPNNSIYFSPDLELIHYIRPEKTRLLASLQSCIQRAKNVANLQRSHPQYASSSSNLLLLKLWILVRRSFELMIFVAVQFLKAGVKRAPFSRPCYEVIYSGKLQALVQVAFSVVDIVRHNRP